MNDPAARPSHTLYAAQLNIIVRLYVIRLTVSHRVVDEIIAPCLPWRAGAAAAAVRSAAVTALSAALESHLIDPSTAAALVQQRLLKHLFSTLGDSAPAATKVRGLNAVRLLLAAVAASSDAGGGGSSYGEAAAAGKSTPQERGTPHNSSGRGAAENASGAAVGLSRQNWTTACRKLGKRLEDSSDAVRVAACEALAKLIRCRAASYDEACGDGNQRMGDDTKQKDADEDADVDAAAAALCDALRLHAGDDNHAVAAAAQDVLRLWELLLSVG